MNVKKIAAQDAYNWARAEMFFGKGAGTRRKLLSNEIAWKKLRIEGYQDAFQKAYLNQNMAEHAIKAAKERRYIDRTAYFKRNIRGFATGRRQSFTTGVGLVFTGWVIAKQTGLDEPIKREVKTRYFQARTWAQINRAKLRQKYGI